MSSSDSAEVSLADVMNMLKDIREQQEIQGKIIKEMKEKQEAQGKILKEFYDSMLYSITSYR
jgi:hypothetical protein